MKNDLSIRCLMSKDTLPRTGDEQAIYALVDIRPGDNGSRGSLPANFGLVLDRSGSMDGEKMENLKEAVGYVLDRLDDHDLVSVTIFDDQVETLVPNQAAGNRKEIKRLIEKIIPRGGTQISDGLKAGIAELRKGISRDRVNRILLLTDGRTWDDEEACARLAEAAGKDGIAVTSIGIGDDWNEKLLLEIAERSHGNSHWIQNPVSILDVFKQEVDGIQAVAAVNVKMTARMSPGVRPVRVHATVPMISDISKKAVSGSSVIADLGSLDGKRGQVLLIEARIPDQKPGKFRIGKVDVTYDSPSAGANGRSVAADMFVTFTADPTSAGKVNAEVMNLAEKVNAFKLQTRALTEAEAGNIAAATRKLESAATVFLNMGEDELARAAEEEILSLKKTGTLTSAGTKKLEYGTRKLTVAMK